MKHSPCEAWSFECFFYVVMKVLMFIELVSGVKYPKITTVGFVLTLKGRRVRRVKKRE